jgi:two-component system response regulator HydG
MSLILVVEDDPDLRPLLEHVLVGAQHDVDVAETVAGGLALLSAQIYDLVIADGRLPDGTGMEVAAQAEDDGVKAMIITGYAFDLPREQLERFEYLLKPVRPHELLQAVERALSGHSARNGH